MTDQKYIVFDGNCGFCNRGILFIAQKDTLHRFLFVSNQSVFGQKLLTQYDALHLIDDSILLFAPQMTSKSKAVIKILSHIPRYRWISSVLSFIPQKWSDLLYDIIARNRKKLLPHSTCQLPPLEIRNRFIQ